MPTPSRFSLLNWLLAGIMGLSLALNAYLLTPHYSTPGSRWLIGIADDMWDEDDDDDDTDEYRESRVALADELRRTRLQLEYCRDSCHAVSMVLPAPTVPFIAPVITPAAP
jgi:hypothetical protein